MACTARYAIVMLMIVTTWAFIQFHQLQQSRSPEKGLSDIGQIPLHLGQWWGYDVPLEERVYNILETKAIMHRRYASIQGQEVFLSVVHYPETKVDFHAPEGCLGGRGIAVSKSEKSILVQDADKQHAIKVNRLIQSAGNDKQLIYYFYKTGNYVGSSYIRLRFRLVLNNLWHQDRSASLVRFSTPVSQDDFQGASQRLLHFMQDIYPYMTTHL